MRFGTRRGVTFAIALAALTAGGPARADGIFHHAIPTEVEAIDLNTGGPYYAPPIPYGHYAKDGLLGRCCGHLMSPFHTLAGLCLGLGKGCHACGACGGKGCGLCGGKGMVCGGDGAVDPGNGHHGLGFGHGHGQGLDFGHGHGLGHGKRFNGCGLCGGKGCGICTSTILPSSQSAPGVATTAPAPQVTASPQGCVVGGCGLKGLHKHHGRGICGHDPGRSCGNCGGLGMGGGLGKCFHGPGATCGNCRGNGLGGTGCGLCGGKGCASCMGGKGLHGLGGLGLLRGSIYGLLHPHAGQVEYFVGPGGPVPITPGYVPYVNVVRSPRDFFAFPPFTQ